MREGGWFDVILVLCLHTDVFRNHYTNRHCTCTHKGGYVHAQATSVRVYIVRGIYCTNVHYTGENTKVCSAACRSFVVCTFLNAKSSTIYVRKLTQLFITILILQANYKLHIYEYEICVRWRDCMRFEDHMISKLASTECSLITSWIVPLNNFFSCYKAYSLFLRQEWCRTVCQAFTKKGKPKLEDTKRKNRCSSINNC